jgi:Rrf2 family protein
MLSLTCKAAIKAVIYLGSKAHLNTKSSIKEVSVFTNENEHTVGKLLQKLVKEEIINSAKGPNGGFFVTENQKEQAVINIIHAIDGREVFDQCGLGLSTCSEGHPCPFHNDFKQVRDLFQKMCVEKKVSELYENVNNGSAYLVG